LVFRITKGALQSQGLSMIWEINFVTNFLPAMRTHWLAYIKKAYGEVAPAAASCEDQGTLVVEDDDC
jgi:hypothetical protein